MPTQSARRAFTLIEVLVVISIIGVLVATFLPALGEARGTAQELLCQENVRSQWTGQVLYGTDSKDAFAEHSNPYPLYYRSLSNNPLKTDPYHKLKPDYLPDGKIFYCPLMQSLGGIEADPSYAFSVYAGWGANNPINGFNVYSTYSWFANFTSRQNAYTAPADTVTYLNGEPTWPRKNSECTSDKVVIAHTIMKDPTGPSLDFSHRFTDGHFLGTRPTGRAVPVGYSDGHVIARKNEDMTERVAISVYVFYYRHWY